MNLSHIASKPARELLDLRLDRAVPAVHAAVLLAALWLLGRRYSGIGHDATLYVAQGLNRLQPQSLAQDLFFAYGSQDSYSLFSTLYAPLIGLLGPAGAALALVVAGQVAFLAAAWSLTGRLDRTTRWWSLSLLAVTSGYYGGGGVFRMAEQFATARTLAEPLVVAMLASLLAGRLRVALACAGAATLLHPLVALPGWGVLAVGYLATSQHRALLLGAFALAGSVLLVALTPSIDAAWKAVLLQRSPHLFLAEWPVADFARAAWALSILGLAMQGADPSRRRLLVATSVVGLAGVAASGVLVDLAQNALAAGAQLWRSLWLLQLLAILAVPPLAIRLWQDGRSGQVAAVCVVASCCFGRAEQVVAAGLALSAIFVLRAGRARREWPGPHATRLLLLAILCVAAAGLLFDAQTRLPDAYAPVATDWRDYARVAGSVGLLLPLGALLWLATHSRLQRGSYVAGALLLAFAVAVWDDRGAWTRYVEAQNATHPFSAYIAPGAEVYWPAVSSPAWIVLRTRNWFTKDQGAGVVFSRDAALLWSARESAAGTLRDEYAACQIARRQDCPIYAAAARKVCDLPDGPAYIVVNGQIEGWRELARDGYPGQTFRLYRCGGAA